MEGTNPNRALYEELNDEWARFRQNSVRFEYIFKALPDAAVFTDINRVVLMTNPAFCRVFGYEETEVVGRHAGIFYASREEFERQGEIRFNLTAAEQLQPYQVRYRNKNGDVFFSETVGTVVRDDEGIPFGFLAIVKDITERIETQKALLKAYDSLERRVELRTGDLIKEKEQTQRYLDVAGVMLVALNGAGEITLINQQGCRILKVREEDALGKNWFDHFLPEGMVVSVRKLFGRLMAGELDKARRYEGPVLTRTGEERMISFRNSILTDDTGKVTGILFSGDDITERKRIEEELQQRSQKLEEANIALKVLLKQSSEAKRELENNILANINDLIIPHLENLGVALGGRQERQYLDIIRSNLNQITGSFSQNLFKRIPSLTPREIQVVDFIRNGMTNKDMADLLNLSPRTIETYRDNIRVKLGLKNKRVNLRSHLLSLR